MVEHTKTLKVGDGTEDGVFLGPIQNSMQYEKVKGFFDDVEKNKLKVAVGGKVSESGGYFITPTIIDNPAEDSKIVQEEPFGKSRFSNFEEMLESSADVRFTRTHRTNYVLV